MSWEDDAREYFKQQKLTDKEMNCLLDKIRYIFPWCQIGLIQNSDTLDSIKIDNLEFRRKK